MHLLVDRRQLHTTCVHTGWLDYLSSLINNIYPRLLQCLAIRVQISNLRCLFVHFNIQYLRKLFVANWLLGPLPIFLEVLQRLAQA